MPATRGVRIARVGDGTVTGMRAAAPSLAASRPRRGEKRPASAEQPPPEGAGAGRKAAKLQKKTAPKAPPKAPKPKAGSGDRATGSPDPDPTGGGDPAGSPASVDPAPTAADARTAAAPGGKKRSRGDANADVQITGATFTPRKPPRTGPVGEVMQKEMDALFEAEEWDRVIGDSLAEVGLYDSGRLATTHDGGLMHPRDSPAFAAALEATARKLRELGSCELQLDRLMPKLEQIALCLQRRAGPSSDLRSAAAGLGAAGASSSSAPPDGGSAGRPVAEREFRTKEQKLLDEEDELKSSVTSLRRGAAVPLVLHPSGADIRDMNAALKRQPPRVCYPAELDCRHATPPDKSRAKRGKGRAPKAKRGESLEAEAALLQRWVRVFGFGGAFEVRAPPPSVPTSLSHTRAWRGEDRGKRWGGRVSLR